MYTGVNDKDAMAASSSRNEEELNGETESETSSIQCGSVISTVPDKHGFFGGSQYSPKR